MVRKGRRVGCLSVFMLVVFSLRGAAQQAPPLSLRAMFQPRYQSWIRAHPDEFSWMIFALISQPAPREHQCKVAGGKWTNNAVWETWADDNFTFPTSPNSPPIWGRRMRDSSKHLKKDPLKAFHEPGQLSAPLQKVILEQIPPIPPDGDASGEEVRRNYAAFRTITTRGLWYQEGLRDWFGKHPGSLKFRRGSIEIKAVWAQAFADDTEKFHVNYLADGTPYKLISLHISTNALPQWTWATWEWVGNRDRCDETGCKDAFGAAPPFVSPNDREVSTPYAAGELRPRLRALFRRAGLTDEWTGYRLKGSQILREGQPTPALLGNSQMEGDFLPTASCMACHARARVTLSGKGDCSVGLKQDTQGKTGYTDFPAQGDVAPYTTGFVWAFIRASGRDGGKSCLR